MAAFDLIPIFMPNKLTNKFPILLFAKVIPPTCFHFQQNSSRLFEPAVVLF